MPISNNKDRTEYYREYYRKYPEKYKAKVAKRQKEWMMRDKTARDEWLSNLDPEIKAKQKEADRLSREWDEANKQGKSTGDFRERHHALISEIQEALIPLRTYSIHEHTEPDLDGAYVVHTPNKRRFLYE